MKIYLLMTILLISQALFAQNTGRGTTHRKMDVKRKKGFEGSGGGYKYTHTTHKHLKNQRLFLVKALSGVKEKDFNEVVANHTDKKIDLFKLRQIIENIKSAEMLNPPEKRYNSDEYERDVFMAYSVKYNLITAYKGFFEMYHRAEISAEEKKIMRIQLIHEATHLFGIGIEINNDNNDDKSLEIAKALEEMAIKDAMYGFTACGQNSGVDGDIYRRINGCGNRTFAEKDVVSVNYFIYDHTKLYRQVLNTKEDTNLNVYVAYPLAAVSTSNWSLRSMSIYYGYQVEEFCGSMGSNWKLPTVEQAKYIMNLSISDEKSIPNREIVARNESGTVVAVSKDMEVNSADLGGGWLNTVGNEYNVVCVANELD